MTLQTLLFVASQLLATLVLVPSLAHALEYPGKRRLTREQYLAMQPIYYPGFTWIGIAEPLAILALGALALVTPRDDPRFWLIAIALLAVVVVHLLYWVLTAPVNKVWLRNERLSEPAQRFFDVGRGIDEGSNWTRLRDRWEGSHVARAAAASVAVVALTIASVS